MTVGIPLYYIIEKPQQDAQDEASLEKFAKILEENEPVGMQYIFDWAKQNGLDLNEIIDLHNEHQSTIGGWWKKTNELPAVTELKRLGVISEAEMPCLNFIARYSYARARKIIALDRNLGLTTKSEASTACLKGISWEAYEAILKTAEMGKVTQWDSVLSAIFTDALQNSALGKTLNQKQLYLLQYYFQPNLKIEETSALELISKILDETNEVQK